MENRIHSFLLFSCLAVSDAFIRPGLLSHRLAFRPSENLVRCRSSCGSCQGALARRDSSACRSGAQQASALTRRRGRSLVMYVGSMTGGGVEDDDEEDEPEGDQGTEGMTSEEIVNSVMQMKLSEIRAELDMRGVDNAGITSKMELAKMLLLARTTGIADASILDQFTRNNVEQLIDPRTGEIAEEFPYKDKLRDMTAGDGSLPGGLTPDQFERLASNPELLRMMQNPKMQALLKRAMSRGAESVVEALQDDPELDDLLEKATKEIESLKFFRGV